jgi:uncharacterized protein (DUF58 family)
VRLTRLGWCVVVAGVVLLVAGWAAGLTAVAALGAAAVAATALAATAVIEPPRLDVERRASPREVDRGQPAEISLDFRGTARRARPFNVLEDVGGERRVAAMPALPAGRASTLTYALDTSRRGLVTTGPLVLRRTDPLGLIVAERKVGGTAVVAVRPRRFPLRMLPSGRMRDLEGPTREQSAGTATFHQLREYVPGDDLRHIHWRTSARTGTLVVKELVDTTRPEIVVIVDNRRKAVAEADFDHVVEVAASLLQAAEQDGFPTQLLFADGSNDPTVDGLPAAHLERLTVVARSDADSLVELADALRARGRSLVVVTGELDAVDLQLVGRLGRDFSPAYLVSVVADRTEPFVAPPGMIRVTCRSAEEFTAEWAALR